MIRLKHLTQQADSHTQSCVGDLFFMVGVAQLVERRSVAAEAAGSKPVTHPNPSNGLPRLTRQSY